MLVCAQCTFFQYISITFPTICIKGRRSSRNGIKSSVPHPTVTSLQFSQRLTKNIITTMKYLVLVALFALAAARPQDPEITNLRSEFENPGDGTYNFVYENSDGTIVEQKGYIKNPEEADPEKRIQAMEGSFAYTVDGQPIKVTYVADENGFVPAGDHLPTPPPTPDHVLKTLQILNANAAAQRKRQAQYVA